MIMGRRIGLWHAVGVPAGTGRPRDLQLSALAMAWIGVVLLTDALPCPWDPWRQVGYGILTWLVLIALLRRESPLVRAQTLVVVAIATAVEYTASPLLGVYVYRIHTVPLFVPPGHGLVYLAALAAGRSAPVRNHARSLVAATVIVAGAWATWGLFISPRRDGLGALWFLCLVGFLAWGRSRLLYVGAFVVVSYLELLGTTLGTWTWSARDPFLHVVGQGNPPSVAAGGYGWFDLFALLLAPYLLWLARRVTEIAAPRRIFGAAVPRRLAAQAWTWSPSMVSTAECSDPLVTSALPPYGPSSPANEVNRPPASTTIGIKAAMSYTSRSGSQAMSTPPSATIMYDQKSP